MTPREPGNRRDGEDVEVACKAWVADNLGDEDKLLLTGQAYNLSVFVKEREATARREGYIAGLERGAELAEAEPVLPGDPPAELQMDANTMRAAVICTKRNIAAALREEVSRAR